MTQDTTRQGACASRKIAKADNERTGPQAPPTKFTYALGGYTAEIRDKGWFVARTTPSFGDKSPWRGPFATVDDAARSIASSLIDELIARHSRATTWHGLRPGAPLHGLERSKKSAKGKKSDTGA